MTEFSQACDDEIRGRLTAVLIMVEDLLPTSTTELVVELLDANELGLALEELVEGLAERRARVLPSVIEDLDDLARRMQMDLDVTGQVVPALDDATRSAMDRYLGEVHALLIDAEQYVSSAQIAEAWHLVDHGEAAEGVSALGWVIAEDRVPVDPAVVAGIRRLSEGLVDPRTCRPTWTDGHHGLGRVHGERPSD